MNGFFQREKILNLERTGDEHLHTLLPLRETGSASAAHEAPCLSSWGGTICTA